MAPYSRKRANPFSACRLVMAAVRVVCRVLEQASDEIGIFVLCRGQRDQLYLEIISIAIF
jgi:hypothetical protein